MCRDDDFTCIILSAVDFAPIQTGILIFCGFAVSFFLFIFGVRQLISFVLDKEYKPDYKEVKTSKGEGSDYFPFDDYHSLKEDKHDRDFI